MDKSRKAQIADAIFLRFENIKLLNPADIETGCFNAIAPYGEIELVISHLIALGYLVKNNNQPFYITKGDKCKAAIKDMDNLGLVALLKNETTKETREIETLKNSTESLKKAAAANNISFIALLVAGIAVLTSIWLPQLCIQLKAILSLVVVVALVFAKIRFQDKLMHSNKENI